MKKNLFKVLLLAITVFSFYSILNVTGINKALAVNCNDSSNAFLPACQCELEKVNCKTYCSDPAYAGESQYQSATCVQQRLGLDEINTEGILIKTHPVTYLVYIFRFFLFIVTCIVVFRNVMAGMTIANAKDDAEKRTEGFKKLLNAAIGLVVAFSALGITELIKNAFTTRRDQQLLIECKKLEDREANAKVVERCKELEKQYEAVTGEAPDTDRTPSGNGGDSDFECDPTDPSKPC